MIPLSPFASFLFPKVLLLHKPTASGFTSDFDVCKGAFSDFFGSLMTSMATALLNATVHIVAQNSNLCSGRRFVVEYLLFVFFAQL